MNKYHPSPTRTLFLSPQAIIDMVRRLGMAATLQGMAAYIRQDFLRWQSFDKAARVASHSSDGVIELMPIADADTYTFKYVNGHPKNTTRGLSTVMAFGVLAEVATGAPLLISELTLCTAMRTAATSAVAALALARPDSRVMALIGNGAQGEFQALAFHHLVGVEEVRLYDIDALATAKLMHNLQDNPDAAGLRLVACHSVADAVRGADIVTTITADKTNATIITADLLAPGMHLNGVGGDCPGKTEIHADVLRAAKVFVEFEPQTRIEGDLQQMPADFAVTELWQVLSGQKAGRDSDMQITFFDSVGFALEDFSALRFVFDQAHALSLGAPIELIAQLADPKDLYCLLRPATAVQGTLPIEVV
ncbi:MAG: ornithine cyclodeaminase [Rhodoferax sp.]|jgi:ornithine cyclodeaminase|uniref:ornithine cyclodeaminase n=1 Tax=Rhodoferax sp. TaxID=50421 RepID=UPI001B61E3D8|nr:ornithine cyclodeaminase [Rhodoferax sp.]MBP8285850.1 ornithine cyclodeaminase [Rhodoferax sp.]MBP9147363.1 ornithine cyclodeaminase [Rhodoferax sp.]MBP9736493.1 ornithine cyclodeaminase [Rhodoferax sp.]